MKKEHPMDNTRKRKHKLLPKELRRKLPALYSNEDNPDPMVVVKFFDPCSQWTWYATEFDGEDIFFGLVVGHEAELGYWSLSELEETINKSGIPLERDCYWTPKPLSEVKKEAS